MVVVCEECGSSFDAARPSRRFCTDTCRKRNARSGSVIPLRSPDVASVGSVLEMARSEMDEAGLSDTTTGRVILSLAARIDAGNETGAATAALAKELGSWMDKARVQANRAVSPVDELRRRRLERMSGA